MLRLPTLSETDQTHIHNAKDLEPVMPVHNLIEYSNNYSKSLGGLWQYCRYETDDDDTNDMNHLNSNQDLQLKLMMLVM